MIKKMIIEREIENCNKCVLCKVENTFSSHVFICKHYKYVSREISSPNAYLEAEKQMSEWFKNCKVWADVKE